MTLEHIGCGGALVGIWTLVKPHGVSYFKATF